MHILLASRRFCGVKLRTVRWQRSGTFLQWKIACGFSCTEMRVVQSLVSGVFKPTITDQVSLLRPYHSLTKGSGEACTRTLIHFFSPDITPFVFSKVERLTVNVMVGECLTRVLATSVGLPVSLFLHRLDYPRPLCAHDIFQTLLGTPFFIFATPSFTSTSWLHSSYTFPHSHRVWRASVDELIVTFAGYYSKYYISSLRRITRLPPTHVFVLKKRSLRRPRHPRHSVFHMKTVFCLHMATLTPDTAYIPVAA